MNQLRQLFERLSWRQRIFLVAAILAVLGGLYSLARWNRERDFKPLFSGLSAEDAGALLAKLKETGVDYRLADNGATVLAPSDRIAELRLQMAAAGVPKSGRIGFELFDKTTFGASDFTEQVNYHRAIEGELERSVMSIREVEQARVHVTMAKESLYTESRQPAKASILVKLRSGAVLSPQNVAAIAQLAASAVPGLQAAQVSVIDTNGNLLNRPRPTGASDGIEASEAALEYRKSVERDLQNKISATLDPLLGSEHFRVGVSAEVDLSSGDQSEEVFDPQKSVMVSSQKSDDGPALPAAAGVPGTASNVPVPTSKPTTTASNYARHSESITYQTSRVVRTTHLPQGGVKRLSLSVLVDHSVRYEGAPPRTQRIIEAPSADKLRVIRGLVVAATGLDMARGDQLVVEAFPFESTLAVEPLAAPAAPPAVPSGFQFHLPPWAAKQMEKHPILVPAVTAGASLLLIAILIVLLKLRKRRRIKAEQTAAALETAKQKAALPTPEDVEREMQERLAEQAAEKARADAEALMALKSPVVTTKKTEVLSKHIATEAKTNPSGAAQVVRTWLNG